MPIILVVGISEPIIKHKERMVTTMLYDLHFGKVKDNTPYTMNAMQGTSVVVYGLKNVTAFAGGKLKRLKPGCYWGIIDGIEYYAVKRD